MDTMSESLQLDLFSWDRIKVGEGFRAMENLDLQRAEVIFGEVLSEQQGHPDASSGQRMVVDWLRTFRDVDALKRDDAIIYLWKRIKTYPFGLMGEGFKRVLIRKLIGLIQEDYSFYVPPDLCLGCLYIEVGEYAKAEDALRLLIERHPSDGRLLAFLGNALLMQGMVGDARVLYTKGLLTTPWEIRTEYLKDDELIEVIEDVGPYMTPIYGWLRGVLPLVEIVIESPKNSHHESALNLYQTINLAEKARLRGDYSKMVEYRSYLKDLSPDVFEIYMERIKGVSNLMYRNFKVVYTPFPSL